jgi:chaperonin GroEL
MVQEGLKYLAAGMNPMALRLGIERAIERVVTELKAMAQPCDTPQAIAHVAAISANNDSSIGDLIARAMDKVGREGAIAIEDGSGMVSELNVVEGLQFDRGYLSPYFVNNAERGSALLEDVLILLCDRRLSSITELVPLLEAVAKSGRPLLVIAEDIDSDALATLVINSVRGAIKTCAVKAPGFGDRRKAMLQDMAALTGGKVISDELGRSLAKATLDDLGQAKRIEVDKDSTTLIGGGGNRSALQARMALVRQERDRTANEYERKQLDERLSRLAGGVALIKVGAATETELKERKLRVEDALHATRAAVDEGIVPGGGVALLRARRALDALQLVDLDENSGVRIIARALEEPLRRILINAGEEPDVVLHQVLASEERNYGYNAATRNYGDLLAMGVIDPAKVTRLALQNAASIASLILSIDCMIAVTPNRPGTTGSLSAAGQNSY